MAIFPGAVATDSDLYIAVNALSTQLTDNPLTSGATTVNVTDATLFPTVGFISIDNEIIKYTGKTGTSFTGCTRGADGTAASSHVQNSQVFHNVIAAHHNALKDEIKAIEQNISDRLGLGSTQILGGDGTAALPTYTFGTDPDTGIYRTVANTISFSAGGANRFSVSSTFVTSTVPYLAPTGTAAAPSYASATFPNSGFSINSAGNILIGISGITYLDLSPTTLEPDSNGLIALGASANGFSKLFLNDGTAAAPAFTFSADTNTGIFRNGTDNIGFATAGSSRWQITASGDFAIIGGSASQLLAGAGTAALPSYSFNVSGQTDTGIYSAADDAIGFSSGGTLRARLSGDQFEMSDGTNTSPAWTFRADLNTGIYRSGTDTMAFVGAGTAHANVDATSFNVLTRFVVGAQTTLTDNLSVTSVRYITDSTNGTFNGLSNGVTGQVLYFVNSNSAGNTTFVFNSGTGTQKFILPNSANMTVGPRGGATFIFDGSNWYVTGKVN